MERQGRIRHSTILIGIGLLLVGLLAGILTMMFVSGSSTAPAEVSPVVERVELGQQGPAEAPETLVPREPVAPLPEPEAGSAARAIDTRSLNLLFKDVAQQVTPAVVYIQVETASGRDVPRNLDDRFFRDLPRQSVGSGVIISQQGYVATNHHVVDRANTILVTLSDKRQFEAEVVGVDPSTDLAVLKLEDPVDLPVIAFGDSDKLEVGEWVLAIGNPFRLTSTVTAGIVSALGRQVNIINDRFSIEDFVQTDAAINPGNSGGALVNLDGKLIGISTAIATESGSYEGYGFAVPVNLMNRVVRDLIDHGEVQRGFLGVTIQEIDARGAEQLGLDHISGVYVSEVQRNGSAFDAGLRDGDVVLSVEDRDVNAPNELQSAVARHRPGERVKLTVWRSGETQHIYVLLKDRNEVYGELLAEAPPRPRPQPELDLEAQSSEVFQLEGWGVGLKELSDRERVGFDVQEGVYVAYVEKGSSADAAGLPRDIIILRIDGETVRTVEDAVGLLGPAGGEGETVLLRVKRRDGVDAFYELAGSAAN